MMPKINKAVSGNKILIIILILLILITFQCFKLKKAVFAEVSKTIILKVSLLFNADIDKSARVDGKDLALLMFFFGKDEKNYISNSFKVNPDLNGDKIVDGEDLVILASHFGLNK